MLNSLPDAINLSRGGSLRAALDRLLCSLGFGPCPECPTKTSTLAFTVAVVALGAKLAKADGFVSRVEIETFHQVFQTPANQSAHVQRVYDLAKQDVAGFESYARQIANLLADETALKHDVFEGLFHIAASDGILHHDEQRYLQRIGEIFGFSEAQIRSVRALFVYDPEDAYTVLGVTGSISDEDLRVQYRRLVRQHHPDAAIARGVPEEFVDMANRKLAAINAAYEEILRERGQ
ncbi:MAG: TerB family tellurite resistance protein [Hyphomicrobiaceae bacterium]